MQKLAQLDLENNALKEKLALWEKDKLSLKHLEGKIKPFFNFVHPDDRGRVKKSFNLALSGSLNNWTKEYLFQKADGTFAYVQEKPWFPKMKTEMRSG